MNKRKVIMFVIGTGISLATGILAAFYGTPLQIAGQLFDPVTQGVVAGVVLFVGTMLATIRTSTPISLGNQGKGEEVEETDVSSPLSRPTYTRKDFMGMEVKTLRSILDRADISYPKRAKRTMLVNIILKHYVEEDEVSSPPEEDWRRRLKLSREKGEPKEIFDVEELYEKPEELKRQGEIYIGYSIDELDEMKKSELVKVLADMDINLPIRTKKDKLIERIFEAYVEKSEVVYTFPELDRMKITELKKILDNLGFKYPRRATKPALIVKILKEIGDSSKVILDEPEHEVDPDGPEDPEEDSASQRRDFEPIQSFVKRRLKVPDIKAESEVSVASPEDVKVQLAKVAPQLAEVYDALPADVQAEILSIHKIAESVVEVVPLKTLEQIEAEQYKMPNKPRSYVHRRGEEEGEGVPPPREREDRERTRIRRKKERVEVKGARPPRRRLKKHKRKS